MLTTETCKAAKKHMLKRGTQVIFWTFTVEHSSSRGRMESIDTDSNVDNTPISASRSKNDLMHITPAVVGQLLCLDYDTSSSVK